MKKTADSASNVCSQSAFDANKWLLLPCNCLVISCKKKNQRTKERVTCLLRYTIRRLVVFFFLISDRHEIPQPDVLENQSNGLLCVDAMLQPNIAWYSSSNGDSMQ